MSSSGDGRHLDSALYSLFWLLHMYLFCNHHCLGQTLTVLPHCHPSKEEFVFTFLPSYYLSLCFPKHACLSGHVMLVYTEIISAAVLKGTSAGS